MNHLIAILLLLLPAFGQAQDSLPYYLADHHYFGPAHFANAKDSADFTRIWKDLRFADGSVPSDTVDTTYRLQWIVSEHGGISSLSRGDSSILHHEPDSSWGLFPILPFRLSDGRRGVQVFYETPCGMICLNASYYVEE